MSTEEMKIESTGRTAGEEYWRNEYRKAKEETEFYKHWSEAHLFLLGVATFAVIYLSKFGG